MSKKEDKRIKGPLIKFGPFEQAIGVLLIMGLATSPTLPFTFLQPQVYGAPGVGGLGGIPLFTPPMVMLVLIAYLGYHILMRQEAARTRDEALRKAAAKSSSSSSSSSSKPMSSSDVRSKGMPSALAKYGDPAPKHVSGGSGLDPRKDPSSNAFKKNYFLTMQGPGRPALVPFQDGLRPKAGEAEGTMWWDNVPEDASQLMAPPFDPEKIRALMKNPYAVDMIEKDIELLKLKKRKMEEEERYEKVGSIMQTMLGALLCAVDMRLGIAALVFFLYRHFTLAHQRESDDQAQKIEDEKKDLMKRISEAKKSGADSMAIRDLQTKLSRLG